MGRHCVVVEIDEKHSSVLKGRLTTLRKRKANRIHLEEEFDVQDTRGEDVGVGAQASGAPSS